MNIRQRINKHGWSRPLKLPKNKQARIALPLGHLGTLFQIPFRQGSPFMEHDEPGLAVWPPFSSRHFSGGFCAVRHWPLYKGLDTWNGPSNQLPSSWHINVRNYSWPFPLAPSLELGPPKTAGSSLLGIFFQPQGAPSSFHSVAPPNSRATTPSRLR